jgi:hypothetical protein
VRPGILSLALFLLTAEPERCRSYGPHTCLCGTARELSFTCMEDEMTELEMKDDVETEEFTDELSDEALDREQGGGKACCHAGPAWTGS